MACPECGGSSYRVLDTGLLECMSNSRVVDSIPPGMMGNHAPTPIPIFGTCGVRYSSEAGAIVDRRIEEEQQESEKLATELAERAAAKEQTYRELRTNRQVAEELADRLLTRYPEFARPVIVEVECPPRMPLRPRKWGWADTGERAWAVGTHTWSVANENGNRYTQSCATGLLKGKVKVKAVILRNVTSPLQWTSRMRRATQFPDRFEDTPDTWHSIRATLERDLKWTEVGKAIAHRHIGRPVKASMVSEKDLEANSRIRSKAVKMSFEVRRLELTHGKDSKKYKAAKAKYERALARTKGIKARPDDGLG